MKASKKSLLEFAGAWKDAGDEKIEAVKEIIRREQLKKQEK